MSDSRFEDNGELFGTKTEMDLLHELKAISQTSSSDVKLFYQQGMDRIERLGVFLVSIGMVGVMLPSDVRIQVDGGVIKVQQYGQPCAHTEPRWYTLNGVVDGSLPPFDMFRKFLITSEDWLKLVVEQFKGMAAQMTAADDASRITLSKIPSLKRATR